MKNINYELRNKNSFNYNYKLNRSSKMIHIVRLIFTIWMLNVGISQAYNESTVFTTTILPSSIITSTSPQNYSQVGIIPANNCASFSVASGTGCAWMCNYCANTLGTFNYYFTDNVCVYQTGGCVGNPVAGKTYTCCSV